MIRRKIHIILSYIRWKLRGEVPTEHLKKKGLIVGENFNRQNDCIIDYSHCWLINIGDNVTLAPRVHILAHDASTKMFLGYAKIGKVTIGNNVFVGSSTTILPNVTIGDNVIIGSGSIVNKDIESGWVVAGNPVKKICTIDEYLNKNRKLMETRPMYGEEWTLRGDINDEKKQKMLSDLSQGIGYIY